MGAFVDAAYACRRVAVTERDEDPDERVIVRVAGELQHKGKRATGGGLVVERQVQLGAARELGLVRAERLAGPQFVERDTVAF